MNNSDIKAVTTLLNTTGIGTILWLWGQLAQPTVSTLHVALGSFLVS